MKTNRNKHIVALASVVLVSVMSLIWAQGREETGEAVLVSAQEQSQMLAQPSSASFTVEGGRATPEQKVAFKQLQQILADRNVGSEAGSNASAWEPEDPGTGAAGAQSQAAANPAQFDFTPSSDGRRAQAFHPRQPLAMSISAEDARISLKPQPAADKHVGRGKETRHARNPHAEGETLERWGWDLKLTGLARGSRVE